MIDTAPAPTTLIRRAADALVERYRTAPAAETEAGLALLALWALDAVEAGRVPPADADAVFTTFEVETSDPPAGPELSATADQLVFECMLLHDWGTPFSAEPAVIRQLAFAILDGKAGATAQNDVD